MAKHEDWDERWQYHGEFTEAELQETVVAEKKNSGLPFDWCTSRCVSDCDTCKGRSDSDPLPHSWEDSA